VQAIAGRHVLSYGGNVRFNFFDLSIAPSSDDRFEFGGFAQDEIFINKNLRWVVGARVDRFDYIDNVVFSPRTTLLIKPQENHTFRVSYNRAYRSPSVINNHLDLVIAQPINIAALGGPAVYPLPVNITGNTDLKEQSLDAFEIGYSAVVRRAILSAAYYKNWVKNEILFTEDITGRYTAAHPPANWPVPAVLINFVPGGSLPGRFTYLNFGKSTQQGIELGVNSPLNRYVDMFVNYSWQDEPDPKDFALTELNIPAKHRFNAGVAASYRRYQGNVSVTYSDKAYWQDVLSAEYAGTTESYTMVNAGLGAKWMDERFTTSLKVINLGNQSIQQHAFGDVIRRQIVAELRVNVSK
jgi:outer membrane receptor protein involved in Fe transport